MKGKNNSKEVLKQKIREVLNQNSEGVSDLSNKGIDELVAEVSIYHQELEYQNEELMRIRDELEITKEHFKSLYNDAPIGYTLCSEDLTIQSANTKFCDLISCKERTILKKKLTDYIQPESQDDFYFHIKDLIKSKTPKENEIKLLSGTDEITVKLVSNTFTEEGNRFIRIAVFDISKEKKLEAETLKSRQKLKSYIDTSPTPIFIANAEGKYTYVNHAACELFGYKYEELTELSITDLAKEVTKEFLQAWDEVRTFGYVKGVELVLKSKSDDPVYVLLDSVKVSDDEFIAFVVDITHRKFEEEKYRSIISSSIDGFCILDEKGNFIEANEAYAKMIGYSSSELTSGMGLIDIEANEDSKDIARHINKIIEQGTDQFITKQRSKSGKVIDIEISTAYIPSQNHFVVFVRDVTEQQKSKDLLIQNERLLTQAQHTANMGHYNLSFITGEWSSSAGLDNIFEIGPSYKKSVEGWLQLVHPDHLEEMQKHLNEDVIKNKKPFNRQYKIIGQETGKIKWVHGKGELIFSEDGNPQKMSGIIQDITNQKLVEEELRENNLRFVLAVESAGIAVWDWDVENNILRWDDKMHELYEVDKDNFEGAYATWISALHEDDKERINNEINLAIENKKDYNTEFKIKVKDGKVKYLRAFAKTLRDESGKATKMIGVNYDITELKKAQQEIIASEQRFKTIFTDSLAIMLIIDPATRKIVDVNKTAEIFYGYEKKEFTQLKIDDLNINSVEIINRDMQQTIKNSGGRFEFRHRLSNGEIRNVEVFSTPITLDGKTRLNSIIHDITDRKKTENALLKSEEHYRNFFEHDLTGDYLTTLDGQIVDCNPALVKILGYSSRTELLETNSYDLYPEKPNRDKFLKLISDKKVVTDHEIELKKKDGTIIHCLENCIGIFDDEDNLTNLQGYLFDITEEIKSTAALRESQQRFYSLFENMVEGFALHEVVTDKENKPIDYIFLDVNPSYEKLTGLKKADVIGKKVTEVLPGIENEPANWIEKYGNVAISGNAISFEDYSEAIGKWYSITAYCPQELQFAVIIEDITTDKKAENELKFQAKLLEEIGESVIATNNEGKVIYWNHAAELLYGWKEEEVLGKNIIDVTPSNQSSETAEEVMKELLSGNRWFGEMQLKKKNGETFDAYVTDSPFFDENGNLVGIIGVSKDISELKKVEKDLRSRNEFIQTVLDNLPIGIALNKINDGTAQYMNKKFEEIYGWPEEEMKEIPEFFERIYPDVEYREQIVAKIVSDINSRDPRKMYWENIEIRTKENEVKKVNAQNIPLFEQNTMVSTVLDVTAVKNAEKILVESQRLSAIGEMSSAIAHDFNNSLQSILGNLDLSLIQLNENHPSRRYLETIKNATTDAAARVRALQRFAGKSKSRGSYSELNVNQMIEDVIQQSRPLWKDSREKDGIQFKIVTDLKEVKSVLGNEGELKSVLYNAIKNSVEAMPKGGNITINTYQKNKNVGILITDEGKGMDEKTKARIFQPFFSTKGFEAGRGLGMSGAYSIINEHNGSIYIKESSPNTGTSLAIELPPYFAHEKNEKPAKKIKKHNGKANILWVDDDKMIREVAQEMISVIGHKGKVVGSGKEAIEELEKEEYDLLVTDIGMPGMSGWELIEKIKKTNDSKLKIAVLTGWGDQIGDEEKNKHKISHVISKPFKIDQLSSIIGSILSEE